MSLEDILISISKYLNENNVPHVVVGGWAAIAWGRQRTTFDIDLIIDHNKIDLSSFVRFLKKIDMLIEREDIEIAIKEKSHSSIIYSPKPSLRVNLKGVYTIEDKEAILTSKKINITNTTINICSPENLIAHKLKFGSDRYIEDALIVFLVQKSEKNIDLRYLTELCEKLSVSDKLKELVSLSKKNKKL